MSTKIDNVITQFTKFLDTSLMKVKKSKTIEDLLKLPISCFSFMNKNEVKIIEDLFEVFDISEAANLNKINPFEKFLSVDQTEDPIKDSQMREQLEQKIEELKHKYPNLERNLKKMATISSIINSVSNIPEETTKCQQKVVVVGLDNAGKTAILTKFGGRLGINDLAKLKPTKGISRKKFKSDDLELVVWDFGGQEQYRKKYLETPEQYFLQLNLLIYVVDVQDPDRFEESMEYFDKILDTIYYLEEKPYIMIYIHKYDPDLKTDPEILLNIELLKDKLNDIIQEKHTEFHYEIYLTSIFSLISTEPRFSKYIKDIMSTNISLSDPVLKKVEGLGKILEETMNAIIRLSESTSLQIREIDHRLRAIESGAVQVGQVNQTGAPMGMNSSIPQQSITREDNMRANVLDELKILFKKQKRLEL
ncbi:MAG: ADP-ribosylation factor-like protein [Promethearchaeota archaeon]